MLAQIEYITLRLDETNLSREIRHNDVIGIETRLRNKNITNGIK